MADPLNPNINVNPSPKQRFVAVAANIGIHRDLIQRPDTQRAFDFALAQMVWEESSVPVVEGNSAAASYYRMAGAQKLISILKTLAETPVIAKRTVGEKEMTV